MGCFSLSCCITRTEIRVGEPVLVVFMRPTYNSIPGTRRFSTNSVLSAHPINERFWNNNQSCGEFLHLAVEDYDDYGNVPSHVQEETSSWWDFQFIAHKSVCENLLGRELGEGVQLEKDFFELIRICNKARIEVYHDLLGFQHLEQEELDLQELVHKETGRMLAIKKEQLMEYKNDF
jgi:hypothetical protein